MCHFAILSFHQTTCRFFRSIQRVSSICHLLVCLMPHLNAAWILKMWSNVKSSISLLLLDRTELCLCCQTCAELTHLHSLSCSHCSTEADKVLHHPDLGRTAGSMGCNRVWGAAGGTGTLLRAWPDTSPFRSITFPLSVLEPPSPFVAFFLLRPI